MLAIQIIKHTMSYKWQKNMPENLLKNIATNLFIFMMMKKLHQMQNSANFAESVDNVTKHKLEVKLFPGKMETTLSSAQSVEFGWLCGRRSAESR